MNLNNHFYSIKKAAKVIGVDPRTVGKMIEDGKFSFHTLDDSKELFIDRLPVDVHVLAKKVASEFMPQETVGKDEATEPEVTDPLNGE